MLHMKTVCRNPKELAQIRALYRSSFPKRERVPLFYLIHKAKKREAGLYGIYEDAAFAGLLYTITHQDMVFVFYFAIHPSLRGKGFGSRALTLLKRNYRGKRILLNIEAIDPESDNNEERVRRKKFYQKNGFEDTRLKTREGGVVYELLCHGGSVSYGEYAGLMQSFLGSFLYHLFYQKIPMA